MSQHQLELALQAAIREAEVRSHEYVTLEHLLYALLHEDVAAKIVHQCGGDVDALKNELETFLDEELDSLSDKSGDAPRPSQTIGFQRVLQRAILHVQSSGGNEVNGGNVLIALFREPDSHAVYFLEEQGITRLDLVNYVSHGVSKRDDDDDDEEMDEHDDEFADDESEEGTKENRSRNPIKSFMSNLTALARDEKIDPLIGRDTEVERLIQVLCRRRKNNPILVGDPGVGKTAIVEGLALRVVKEEVPEAIKDIEIFSLDLGSLLAGTKFRGEFEERLKKSIKALRKKPNSVLFIDEIHMIVGAGATSGGSMDASNLLKPALQSGELRCIGATTHEDFRRNLERDRALVRRFQKIDIVEPSVSETIQILKGLRSRYEEHHDVKYTDEALKSAAELSDKYVAERRLPDKAIDIIDEAGAYNTIQKKEDRQETLSKRDIEVVVSKIARIPDLNAGKNERTRLKDLETQMLAKVYGQDNAVTAVVDAIKLSRAGLGHPDKPVGSFLFAGPTGVGKTEVAKQLAEVLGIEFIRFDMSEYMEKHAVSRLIGAPPGYVGYDQGGQLTEKIRKTPHAVLLLDEIEKAHPDLFDILLQVMDHATLTDNTGREADFRNVILIMTSNAGARDMTRKAVGFERSLDFTKSLKSIEKKFSPEFRNRLNQIVLFNPLPKEVMLLIVDKFVGELQDQLATRNVVVELGEAARTYLADKGYDELYGARPLARLIEREVRQPMANELLFGALEHGGRVLVGAIDDKLTFEYTAGVEDTGSEESREEVVEEEEDAKATEKS